MKRARHGRFEGNGAFFALVRPAYSAPWRGYFLVVATMQSLIAQNSPK
jgi:hypothetical protein